MNIIRSILPYGLANYQGSMNFRKLVRNLLPNALAQYLVKRNAHKIYTVEYLKSKYVSDLTEREKWALLAMLLYLERKQEEVRYLEVGIYAGGTIKFLQDNSSKSHFTGVDLFEDFKPSADNTHEWKNYTMAQVWEVLGKNRVMLHKGFSTDQLLLLQKENKKYDFIFIDGNHTYEATKEDFEHSLPLLNAGGYIAFHNCSPGMTQEDRYYLKLDGGPWSITIEMLGNRSFKLIETVDRIRIFQLVAATD